MPRCRAGLRYVPCARVVIPQERPIAVRDARARWSSRGPPQDRPLDLAPLDVRIRYRRRDLFPPLPDLPPKIADDPRHHTPKRSARGSSRASA